MDLQSLKEFPSSAVGYFVALLVGALTSFLVTKWAMAREEKGRLINAAEGIKSAADRIVTIEKMIVQQQALVETIATRPTGEAPQADYFYSKEFLSSNPQLFARLKQEGRDKCAVGKYIRGFISNESVLAVDCGTSAAWAFLEITRDGFRDLQVITNNIFVPMFVSGEYKYNETADTWGVQETASRCYVTHGNYFPSYGAILDTSENSEALYREELERFKPTIVILGCTSFRADEGPSARSGINRSYKRCLLQYAIDNSDVYLFIVITLNKLGLKIGEPCSVSMWEQLSQRDTVYVLCGTESIKHTIDSISGSQRAVIREEIRIMDVKRSKNRLLLVDSKGDVFDFRSSLQ